MKICVAILVITAVWVGVGLAEDKEDVRDPNANYTMTNDTISVILNDVRYPLDDFDFPLGTTNLWNMYIGFYDGAAGYYFNSPASDGCLELVLIGSVVETGTDPDKTISMTFADADPPTRFTIDLEISMLGNGTYGVRGEATITNLVKARALDNCKFYLITDLSLVAGDPDDVTAYDAGDDIFYAYDSTNAPNVWFGCHSDTGFPLHYQGLPYSGGMTTLRTAIAGGNNFADSVTSAPQDQVAGWNWDIGTVDQAINLAFSIAANSDYPSLATSLMSTVPVELMAASLD